MRLIREIYKKLFSPIYRVIETIYNRLNELEIRQRYMEEWKNENEKKNNVNLTQELSDIHNSIKYLSDTLAEKSYLIECNSKDIKNEMYELKRHDIRIRTILNGNQNYGNRVIQVVPVLRDGDAIGNYALFIDRVLKERGVDTYIYTYQNLSGNTCIKDVENLLTNNSDVILLHMAAENDFAELITAYSAIKVLLYHNITPSFYFEGFDELAEHSTQNGREQVLKLTNKVDCCITESQYNKAELARMGFTCPIYVTPIPYKDEYLNEAVCTNIKNKICDNKVNLLFVGRAAPNKKLEDVIACYQVYRDKFNSESRLIFVGHYNKEDKYFMKLSKLIRDIDNVVFTGHVSEEEKSSYYRCADIFICMSEHEGFCVPLVEAMSYRLPVVAYRAAAVPETLGNGGVLVNEKDLFSIASKIDEIINNPDKRNEIQNNQIKMMEKYDISKVKENLYNIIMKILRGNKDDRN